RVPGCLLPAMLVFVNPLLVAPYPVDADGRYLLFSDTDWFATLRQEVDWGRQPASSRRFVLVIKNAGGGGVHFFFNRNYPLRSPIFYRHYIRPYDDPAIPA